MAYEHKTNNGTLFPNSRKRKETDPDWTGSINVEGVLYWFNGWDAQNKNGSSRINVKVTEQQTQPQNAPQPSIAPPPVSASKILTGNVPGANVINAGQNRLEDMDEDDIPF